MPKFIDTIREEAARLGLDESIVLAAFSNIDPRLVKNLDNGFLRHDDYARAYQKLNDWHAQVKPIVESAAERDERLRQAEARIAYYERLTGKSADDFDPATADQGGQPARNSQGQFMTRDEFDRVMNERLDKHAQLAAGAITTVSTLATKHLHEFNEPIPIEDIQKFMGTSERQYSNLVDAYNDYVQPRRQKRDQEKADAEVNRRVEERLRDEATRRNIPYNPQPQQESFLRLAADADLARSRAGAPSDERGNSSPGAYEDHPAVAERNDMIAFMNDLREAQSSGSGSGTGR